MKDQIRAWVRRGTAPRIQIPPMTYPTVAPLPASPDSRPFWSVMIPTYRRTTYLEKALRSVLAQCPGPDEMQIEVVDNASEGGDIERIVREVGGGRIAFHRQRQNVGMHGNWNTCIERARGHWVHILHDDDEVLPGFYAEYQRLIGACPEAALVTGPCILVGEGDHAGQVMGGFAGVEGVVQDFARLQATANRMLCPSVVVARRSYERVGGFSSLFRHTPDWEMFFRAGLDGPVLATNKPYSMYRMHEGAATQENALLDHIIPETLLTVELCLARLPEAVRRDVAREKYACAVTGAWGFAEEFAKQQQWSACLRYALWVARLSPGPGSFRFLMYALRRFVASELWQRRTRSA